MGFDSSENKKLSCSFVTLVIVAFLAWTTGVHALPVNEAPSASSVFVGDYGSTDPSSDGSSPTEDGQLRRSIEAIAPSEQTSNSALLHLAFAGPPLRLVSYPGLAQAPPPSR
jgi:hypothetical protein